MSFEPSQEDMLRADPNLGKQIIEQELAAVGKTIADISDEELGRRAREVGLDPDQMQSQFRFKRTPGTGIGIGVEKVKQRTAAQILRGNQEPPPAFFAGIPEAMKQAIAGINRERVAEGVSTGIEDTAPSFPIPTETGRGATVPPVTTAAQGSKVRGLSSPELSKLGFGTGAEADDDSDFVGRVIPKISKELESLRAGNEAMRQEQMGAKRGEEELFEAERKLRERNTRIADVLTQKSRGMGKESTPEERASVINDLVITSFEGTYPGEEIVPDDPRYKEIQDYILSESYTAIFKKQGLKENEVGVVVDPDTGLFKAVSKPIKPTKQPLQSGVGQSGDDRGLLDDVREVFRPNDVQFVDTTWKHYTGVLTPEKRERALNDLKVYETLSKEEKFPPELMDVVKIVAASKPGFGAGRQLSYTEIKDYLSRISYVESKHKNISQIGGGPAVSAFQVEPSTAESLINREKFSRKYFNSSDFNEALDDEFDRLVETNPELMSGYISYKEQGENKAVYKAMQDLSIAQLTKLMSISPAFAGSVAYAKIITGLKGNKKGKSIKNEKGM